MSNYFIIKIDPLINTFTVVDCGDKITFSFKSRNQKEIFIKVEKDDYILGYRNKIKSIFKVISKESSHEITIEKILETRSGIDIENSLANTLLQEEIIKIE